MSDPDEFRSDADFEDYMGLITPALAAPRLVRVFAVLAKRGCLVDVLGPAELVQLLQAEGFADLTPRERPESAGPPIWDATPLKGESPK